MSKVNLSNLNNLQNENTATATINNNNILITAAVENTISRDGTQPNMMNSELDMNSNKIINLPDAVSDQEPVTYGQYLEGITSVNNGVVVDGDFVVLQHNDTMINDRVLQTGPNLDIIDDGPKGNVTVLVSDAELNALASVESDENKLPYFDGIGSAAVTDFTPYARTLVDDEDALTARDTLGVVIGTDVQPHDNALDSLVSLDNGIVVKTAPDIFEHRKIEVPSEGISITNEDGVNGNPILSLSNDLEALEGLTTTGFITRTATDSADTRTITGTSNEISVSNGDGISGDPTLSLPSSLTFTGKTVTGGTFSSPTINTPNISSPTGITKGDVGLGNVDNTSDATKNSASVTLTNKTISGNDNTITDIGTSSIINSTITNAKLANMADSTIKSNISGSTDAPSDNTITSVLDKQLGSTQGSIAYRDASSWTSLSPGSSGNFLKTQGSSANPIWDAIPGGGDMLSANNLSDVANSDTALDNLGGTTVGKAVFKAADESAAREVLRIQRKNYVINGAMMVSQENGSSAGTVNDYYPVDLFRYLGDHDGAISVAQVASVTPAGSPNRLRITVTTADTSIGATQVATIWHSIEGYRVADLMFGSVDARGLVLRFGVKAPAGTYCVSFRNGSKDRSYVAEFTIAGGEANTDVVKEIAIPGCDNGAWDIANGVGLRLSWVLAIGSTYQGSADTWLTSNFTGTSNISNFLDTTGNVFELFDVGLYEGTVAPDFVVPDLYQELHHCKRYFETNTYGGTFMQGSSFTSLYLPLSWQEKRATPTLTLMTSLTNLCWTAAGGGLTPSGFSYNNVSSTAGRAQITSSGAAGVSGMLTKVDARL